MTPTQPPPLPLPKTSAYSRSRTFRIGIWALIGAAGLVVWHGIKDGLIAGDEKLFTTEGVVIEERSTESSGVNRVRMPMGGTNRIQGDRHLHTYLRIQKRDGSIEKFSASEWFRTPKAGWQGQPIRVQRDSRGNLYEIEVAGEVVRDVATTRKYRKIDNKKNQPLMVFLIVIGVPLTIVGYLLSLLGKRAPSPIPPPPLP